MPAVNLSLQHFFDRSAKLDTVFPYTA